MKRPTRDRRSEQVVPWWIGRAWAESAPEHQAEAQRFLRFTKSKSQWFLTWWMILVVFGASLAVHFSRHSGWPDGGQSMWLGAMAAGGMLVVSCLGCAGGRIGRSRYRTVEGFVLGILLGPLGWLITLALPRRTVTAVAPAAMPSALSS